MHSGFEASALCQWGVAGRGVAGRGGTGCVCWSKEWRLGSNKSPLLSLLHGSVLDRSSAGQCHYKVTDDIKKQNTAPNPPYIGKLVMNIFMVHPVIIATTKGFTDACQVA